MNNKKVILELLEKNREKTISGEYIANMLCISRNIVWRAIKDLRKEGYSIEARTNKGYCLTGTNDIISAEGIKAYLSAPELAEHIKVFSEIDSTNREAKAQAVEKAPHGTVIIADHQTQGKGRFSRSFYSPPGTGLYISFILYSNRLGFTNPTSITAYAGLCVCEAIEKICGFEPKIKWVNDVYLNERKICGILTEAVTDFESGNIQEIILGIGINVSTKTEDFPEDVKTRAGSLYPDGKPLITRNHLAAEIIDRILNPNMPTEPELFTRYKSRLFMLGKDITVIQGDSTYAATAIDIDESGALIVKNQTGEIKTLTSGEISITPM